MGRSGGRASDRIGLLLVDLDDFKAANTLFGHTGGDDVLCAAADALREAARGNDLVARLGGDEFAILATGISRPATERLAQRVLDKVAAADRELSLTGFRLSASVGWATHPDPVEDRAELYHRADMALGEVKAGGKAAWRCADPARSATVAADQDDLAQPARLDLVDEAPHRVGVGDERALHDLPDRVADAGLEILERPAVPLRALAGGLLELVLELVVGDLEQAAVRVVDQHDLLGAQLVLGDGQRPDLVVGDHPAGVADHVGVALLQAQQPGGDHAGVHAGHDRHLLAGAARAGPALSNRPAYSSLLLSRSSVALMRLIARELTYSGSGERQHWPTSRGRSRTTRRWTPRSRGP